MEARNMQLLTEMGAKTISDKTYVGQLKNKWSSLLKGINDPEKQGITAILIENQMNHMRNLTEDTRTQQLAYFTKWIFPVLRKVFPNLIANEIVSVQPMSAPVGAVFYFKYIYGASKGQIQAGQEMIKDFDRYYSSEYIDSEVMVDSADPTQVINYNCKWIPVKPKDDQLGYRIIVDEIDRETGQIVQSAYDDGSGAFVNASGGINYVTGEVTDFQFSNDVGNGNKIVISYKYDSEMNRQIPEVNFELVMETIKAEIRKMKIRWSPEVSDDLRAMHGMDAETELVTGISQEVALELDREILMDLLSIATLTTDVWDRQVTAGISELEHLRSLITVISKVSNQIHKKTLRSPANFVVTSPEIAALLSQMSTHIDYRPIYSTGFADSPVAPTDTVVVAPSYGRITSNFGVTRVGTLMNRWSVYQDPYFPTNKILVGLRGDSYMDAGYVWAPYVPLEMTDTFLHPDDQGYRKGLRTRYAKKALRNEFYGTITVKNL
jgi:hypothetical protein